MTTTDSRKQSEKEVIRTYATREGALKKPTRGRPRKYAVETPQDISRRATRSSLVGCKSDSEQALPDYSGIELAYSSQREAWKGRVANLASLETHWVPPEDDPTIPSSVEERKAVVQSLLGAMRDTMNCKDDIGRSFEQRWAQGKLLYDVKDMEKVCWDMEVSICIVLTGHNANATLLAPC